MTALERASRAIFETRHVRSDTAGQTAETAWSSLPVEDKAQYAAEARAVLAVIREPTYGMVWAGINVDSCFVWNVYSAMIDAILNGAE